MAELLRDSLWTFIGAVLALVAIVVSVLIFYAEKQRKRLKVETVARVPLVTLGKEGIDGLEITFEGKPLRQATVVMARISNPGNVPIRTADFESPLTFEFLSDAQLLSASVMATVPERMPVTTTVAGQTVVLTPHLLNPGDSVTVRALLSGGPARFTPIARVVGVPRIEGAARTSVWQPIVSLAGIATVLISFWMSPSPASLRMSEIRAEEIPYLLAALVGGIVAVGSMMVELSNRVQRLHDLERLRRGEDV
jgi:hypothetical protein